MTKGKNEKSHMKKNAFLVLFLIVWPETLKRSPRVNATGFSAHKERALKREM